MHCFQSVNDSPSGWLIMGIGINQGGVVGIIMARVVDIRNIFVCQREKA